MYMQPPGLWLTRERAEGCSCEVAWGMSEVLYGRRKVVRACVGNLAMWLRRFCLGRSNAAGQLSYRMGGRLVVEAHGRFGWCR